MSRFFVNVSDEGSDAEKEELQEIKEEKEEKEEPIAKQEAQAPAESKNKKKKKKDKEEPAKQEGEGQEAAPKEDKKKKEKKKTGQALIVQKKMEEKRKIEEELRKKFCQVFYNVATDYFRSFLLDLKNTATDFNKKIAQKKKKDELKEKGLLLTRKEREKRERDERARQMFEQLYGASQTTINTNITSQTTVNTNVVEAEDQNCEAQDTQSNAQGHFPGPHKLKKKRKLKAQIAENEQNGSRKQSQAMEGDSQVDGISREVSNIDGAKINLAVDGVENWEDLLADENLVTEKSKVDKDDKKAAPVKEQAKTAAQIKQPVSAKEQPKPTDIKPANPLDYFNFSSKNRCPIICIMGHVDTGKTKLLDHIRNTNVQLGEAGGITQQIGASFFPEYKLLEEVSKIDKKVLPVNVEIPGLLIIDTPGHESFANLRSRGSSLCDFAIVVVDIMHGLENQTRESLRMLMERKTPFVIALNKIDRLYQWNPLKDQSSFVSLNKQTSFVKNLFKEQLLPVTTELAKMEINSQVYWENQDPLDYTSIIPTSAITGEGIPDLLAYIAYYTQSFLPEQISRKENEFKATVLEVKKTEGLGATIDIILVNGRLSIDDKIVLSGFNGPITTTIKALLTPHPMKEMRVKNEYLHHQSIVGSIGVKLSCQGLESALAGSSIYKYQNDEELAMYAEELKDDIKKVKKIIKLSKEGVGVAASSLGSLEALLVFLKESKIPVSTVCIGDVSKNDLLKVLTPFLAEEDNKMKKKEFLSMLCFDVKILPEAQKFADDNGIKIITAKIIYHLFDEFTKHVDFIKEQRKKEEGKKAVFPCVLQPVAVFNKKDPVVIGVDVIAGVLRIGTPVCAPGKEKIKIGVVESIEANHKPLKEARKKNGSVAVKIKNEPSILYGRQVEQSDELVSILTRESIDALKEHFRDEMLKEDWDLVRKLKPIFDI